MPRNLTKADIQKRAEEILRDHNLLRVPVDPLEVANKLGIKVMNAEFSDSVHSGVVTKRGNQGAIYLNHKDSATRKRFTIAHEIGHVMIHMGDVSDDEIIDTKFNFRPTDAPKPDDTWDAHRRCEWEANVFAAALLMNQDLVRGAFKGARSIDELAMRFQVSRQAMQIRLLELGLVMPESAAV